MKNIPFKKLYPYIGAVLLFVVIAYVYFPPLFEGKIVTLKVDQARLPNGSVWLGLCLYTPCGNAEGQHPVPPQIIDYATGRTIPTDDYGRLGRQLLSPRETEVLALLAQGYSSKQIADRLCIAINTVHRHRQNILTALQVSNTAMAVQIAIRLNLI